MNSRTKRYLNALIATGLICCTLAAWTVIRVVAWARDLPNRIVIDEVAIANAIHTAIIHSYHEGLNNGDAPTQRQILQDFNSLVADDVTARNWIRSEYSDDLQRLRSSPDAEVAALAAELLMTLTEEPSPDQPLPTAETDDEPGHPRSSSRALVEEKLTSTNSLSPETLPSGISHRNQPMSEVPADIMQRVVDDFGDEQAAEIFDYLLSRIPEGLANGTRPRHLRCILYLAKGDKEKLDDYIKMCRCDTRDVMFNAEYETSEDNKLVRKRDFSKPFPESSMP